MNTIPLSRRVPLQPHEMFSRAWAAEPAAPARPSGLLATFVASARRRLRAVWADWRERRQIHATRVALMNLDDQTLRDIGFVRAEINSVAAEAYGGVATTRDRLLRSVGSSMH
ncbi:MAG TPA: DUF1127 domain-containing protein [Burkholderiaceae bacterium]|nr:DUF1127 domain-containing protein [Burkholderiaceae bacterium]